MSAERAEDPTVTAPGLSIVVPAHDEARFLPDTIGRLQDAATYLHARAGATTEIIVVDNASTDATAAVARALGARVVAESFRNIARVRNTGARAAAGEILAFVDADVVVPRDFAWRLYEVCQDPSCPGGAVDTDYRPARRAVRLYLRGWRILGRLTGMAQGAAQFCRRSAWIALEGYDESLYMGEDVDFYWRLARHARRAGGHVRLLRDVRVLPSARRFDQWPLWRTLVWTNPLFILLFRRTPGAWRAWYHDPPR